MAPINFSNLWTQAGNALRGIQSSAQNFSSGLGIRQGLKNLVQSVQDTFTKSSASAQNATNTANTASTMARNKYGYPTVNNAANQTTQQSGNFLTNVKNWFKGLFGRVSSNPNMQQAGAAGKGFFSRIFGKGSMAVGWFGAAITVAFGVFDGIQEANYNANKEGYKFWQRPGKWLGDFFNRAGRSCLVGFGSLLAGAAAAAAIGTGGLALAVGLGISALVGWGLNKLINNDWPTNTREQMNIDEIKREKARAAAELAPTLIDENKMYNLMDPNEIFKNGNIDAAMAEADAVIHNIHNNGIFVPVFDDRSRPSPFASVKLSEF